MLWLGWEHNGFAFGKFPYMVRREVKNNSFTRQVYKVGQLKVIFSYIQAHEI